MGEAWRTNHELCQGVRLKPPYAELPYTAGRTPRGRRGSVGTANPRLRTTAQDGRPPGTPPAATVYTSQPVCRYDERTLTAPREFNSRATPPAGRAFTSSPARAPRRFLRRRRHHATSLSNSESTSRENWPRKGRFSLRRQHFPAGTRGLHCPANDPPPGPPLVDEACR